MPKKNTFLILIIISLIGSFLHTFKSKIILDSFYNKLVSCNRHQYYDREFSAWDFETNIVHINEYIAKLEMKSPRNFFSETSFYLQNLSKLTNHGPIFSILTRLPIIRSLGIWGFRFLNFCFFVLALFLLNSLIKHLLFDNNARYLTLLISTLSIHGQTIIQHGRLYATGFFLNILSCLILIKLLKSSRYKILYAFILFGCIHLCFLNYFFYVAYLPVIFTGLLTYAYIHHQELNIKKIDLWYLILFLFFCFASLIIYKTLAQESVDQTISEWISNSGNFNLNYYAKNILENYLSLLGNHLQTPWNIVLAITLVFCSFFSGNNKKIIPFYIIFFGIPIGLLIIDYYFHTRTSSIIRYSYASLPALFMIYGLSFSNRGKISFIFLTIFFSIPIFLPQFKNWKTLHYIQHEAIDLAQSTSQLDFNKKKTLIISHMMEIDNLTFCKYLLEGLDKQAAIFDQKTQREIYITTQKNLKVEELTHFIKEKDIKLIILLDHSFVIPGDKRSELYHQLKSQNLSILQKELLSSHNSELKIIKNPYK